MTCVAKEHPSQHVEWSKINVYHCFQTFCSEVTALLDNENEWKKKSARRGSSRKGTGPGGIMLSLLQESHQITTKFHYFPDLGVTERSGSRDNIFDTVRQNFVSNRGSLPLTFR